MYYNNIINTSDILYRKLCLNKTIIFILMCTWGALWSITSLKDASVFICIAKTLNGTAT